MSTEKMDISTVFEMFETIKKKLEAAKPQTDTNIQPYMQSVHAITERLETITEEIRNGERKPAQMEHRHTMDIGSNKIVILLFAMALLIIGLSYVVGEQRRTISQYKHSDLKYRYVKMQGQTDEDGIYRLERQFRHADSIKIIRRQVEKYEELVRERAAMIERTRRNSEQADRLQEEIRELKSQ